MGIVLLQVVSGDMSADLILATKFNLLRGTDINVNLELNSQANTTVIWLMCQFHSSSPYSAGQSLSQVGQEYTTVNAQTIFTACIHRNRQHLVRPILWIPP